jgi:hypothetical protein
MLSAVTEQRRSRRQRVFKAGKISFHNDWADLDCIVRDLSDKGAGLIVENPATIPERFTLTVQSSLITQSCRIVWRSANRMGVTFQ